MTTLHGYNVLDPENQWPLGTKYIRLWDCGMAWSQLNPARGEYDLDRLDALLADHSTIDFTLVLSGTPHWAASDPETEGAAPWVGPASNSPPAKMAYWEAYCKAVALKCKGRVKAYQIWNEPQLREFWSPYGDIHKLAQMTWLAKRVIGAIDPGARIVAAPVLPRQSSGGMKRASAYLAALRNHDWPVDAFAAHIYPDKGEGTLIWASRVNMVRKGLIAQGAPGRQLWVTEMNFNLMHGQLPDELIVRRVVETAAKATSIGVRRVYWYAYGHHDDPNVLGIPFEEDSLGTRTLAAYL